MEVIAFVGPAGTGKCVDGSSLILLREDSGKARKLPIKEAFQLFQQNRQPFYTLSFSPVTGDTTWVKVLDVLQVAGGESRTLRTKSGNTLTVKKDHLQVRLNGSKKLEVIPASRLKPGDRLLSVDGQQKVMLDPLEEIAEGLREEFYCFALPAPHLYFAGDILTHNSYQALSVAYEYGADAIIDDGILIQGSKIVAGFSAKHETNAIQATRRAIFSDPAHIKEVQEGLKQVNPTRLMVLGTSERMVEKICAALEIPKPAKVIRIEDVADEKEINLARKVRNREGKHVIPVPTIEVKRRFSGYWLESLEVFLGRKTKNEVHKIGEKTIIRPRFSYIGKLTISENAIVSIVSHVASQVRGCKKVIKADTKVTEDGARIRLELTIIYGYHLPAVMEEVQNKVLESVEYMTGLHILELDVEAKEIVIEKDSR